jgi:hypothetical protein
MSRIGGWAGIGAAIIHLVGFALAGALLAALAVAVSAMRHASGRSVWRKSPPLARSGRSATRAVA